MWRTWNEINGTTPRGTVINCVRNLSAGAPNGDKVKNLVISCHGYPGFLGLGEGFHREHLQMFAGWRGLFEKIWLIACYVGRNSNTPVPNSNGYRGDGRGFCSQMAVSTDADVIASSEAQRSDHGQYPFGCIDLFEGRTNLYRRGTGQVTEWSRFRSAWRDSGGHWHSPSDRR